MPSHTNGRPDPAEPPRSNDAPRAEREIATFVRETVRATGADRVVPPGGGFDSTAALGRHTSVLERFARVVERAEHERIPPPTPTPTYRAFRSRQEGR